MKEPQESDASKSKSHWIRVGGAMAVVVLGIVLFFILTPEGETSNLVPATETSEGN